VGHGDTPEEETEEREPKARLFGMVTKEVSLVDRAANARTFLMTKRDAPMAGKQVAKTKTPIAKGPEQGTAESAAANAGAPPGGGPDGTGAPTQSGEGATKDGDGKLPPMQPQVKDALLQALTSLAEKIVDVGDQVKGADTDDKATGNPVAPSILEALGEVSQGISSLLAQYGGEGATAPAAAKDLDGVTENGGVTAQGAQKAADDDKEMAEKVAKLLDAALTKAGRKMAKERLARLTSAISSLSQIARELRTEKNAKTAKVAKSAAAAGSAKELEDVLSLVEELGEALSKSNREHASEKQGLVAKIATLERTVLGKNSLESEAPPGTPTPVEKSVSWPLDMNHPIARPQTAATDFAAPRR
jgi:hypothetical protein